MGSSNKKKKEKKKDFNKAKLKVGKAKAKAANFTNTSFKSKSIVVNQEAIATDNIDPTEQFKQNLSLAATSKTDNIRRDALSYLINQLSAKPRHDPIGTAGILTKLLPLVSDSSKTVRARLLALFRVLPSSEVRPHVEKILMYARGGMTHLSNDIRSDTLNVMEWLIEVAGDDVVSCPGGWLKTLNSFSSMLGWNPNVGSAMSSKGWTSGSKTLLGTKKGPESQARQMQVLAQFLKAGFQPEMSAPYESRAYWDNIYRLPGMPNPFAYLNLFGTPRDEESEMYPDRTSRKRVFYLKWKAAIYTGMDGAKKEGGLVGRAAAALDKVLIEGLKEGGSVLGT
ncbi:Rix1 complex component [Lasiosphaeria hispida]|uniref:Pre-rRNA-processing protein n=1 Tax=Lasiosphaeria hispida TaxID=260671 RepID=A0AAJ0MK87_9PEZI|nr:Rix1 complex component [Lasiosphaeria hispida]